MPLLLPAPVSGSTVLNLEAIPNAREWHRWQLLHRSTNGAPGNHHVSLWKQSTSVILPADSALSKLSQASATKLQLASQGCYLAVVAVLPDDFSTLWSFTQLPDHNACPNCDLDICICCVLTASTLFYLKSSILRTFQPLLLVDSGRFGHSPHFHRLQILNQFVVKGHYWATQEMAHSARSGVQAHRVVVKLESPRNKMVQQLVPAIPDLSNYSTLQKTGDVKAMFGPMDLVECA